MKQRKGFVSNSSSCAFVVLGYMERKPNTWNEWETLLKKAIGEEDLSEWISNCEDWDELSEDEKIDELYEEYDMIAQTFWCDDIHDTDHLVFGCGESIDSGMTPQEVDTTKWEEELKPIKERMGGVEPKLYTGALSM